LAGWGLGEFLFRKKIWLKISLTVFIVLITLPTTIGALKHYLSYEPPAKIDFEELEALDFLKNQRRMR